MTNTRRIARANSVKDKDMLDQSLRALQRVDPHNTAASRLSNMLSPQQHAFIGALSQMSTFLDSQGISRSSWMVIAGGGVFLYQLDQLHKGFVDRADRVPTDLDIVIDNINLPSGKHILAALRDALLPIPSELETGPAEHFGHILRGPKLSLESSGGLPIDLITELSQRYPSTHRFAPNEDYVYPSTKILLPHARLLHNPLISGEVKVAHPAFITFYKAMLSRNTNGKQDFDDIKRLKDMGELDPSEEMSNNVFSIMCHHNSSLINALRAAVAEL